MSLPSGMFPKNPYTIQLDLSQPSLRDVVAGESLTATTFQARGPDPVDDDSDGKLVRNYNLKLYISSSLTTCIMCRLAMPCTPPSLHQTSSNACQASTLACVRSTAQCWQGAAVTATA